jgi:hypothetical protein
MSAPGKAGATLRFQGSEAVITVRRNPSCLIPCSHSAPEGACGAELGRHGATKRTGRGRECEGMENMP